MTTTSDSTKKDIYASITNRIVEQLEAGTRPWLKPWNAEHAAGRVSRPLRHNGQPYSGINIVVLWMTAELSGFVSPFWLTFRQALELGGHVKKGEHGSQVVYASTFKKTETDDAGDETEQEIPFLKTYTVFSSDQCEGLPKHFYQLAEPPKEKLERIEAVDRFIAGTSAEIRYGGNQAYYTLRDDRIQMPPFETFRDAESHAATGETEGVCRKTPILDFRRRRLDSRCRAATTPIIGSRRISSPNSRWFAAFRKNADPAYSY
jgi:antirestriction protein ArdC